MLVEALVRATDHGLGGGLLHAAVGIVARLQQQRLLRAVHQQAGHARQDCRYCLSILRDAPGLRNLDHVIVEPLHTLFRRRKHIFMALERVQHEFGDALLIRHAFDVDGADAHLSDGIFAELCVFILGIVQYGLERLQAPIQLRLDALVQQLRMRHVRHD